MTDETWISVPNDLFARLEWLAASRGCSVRELVLEALSGVAPSAPEPGGADEYSDAERDEVAARLASLGYIDE